MAQFKGVFTAPALTVAPCGLLSVASVISHTSDSEDERWIRGFSSESDSYATVRILTPNNDVVTNGTISDATGEQRYHDVFPFFIEVESKRTGFDLIANNPLDGSIKEQIDGASQKAVEFELWDGQAAKALTTPGSGYLTQTGGATILTSGGATAFRALALLEESISLSPTGARGIIHMTRDVASTIGDHLIYMATSRDDQTAYAVTRLGTLVVIGSGYSGNGPVGTTGAAASATNKWMYATGGVEVHLGVSEIVNTSITQGFDPSVNDSIVLVQRPAAVHFDPSIWFTAQVTLS